MKSETKSMPQVARHNEYHVFFGSGYTLNKLRKESMYRKIILDHCEEYKACSTRVRKRALVTKIIQLIRQNNGRFFYWDEQDELWIDVTPESTKDGSYDCKNENIVWLKIMQALRDAHNATVAKKANIAAGGSKLPTQVAPAEISPAPFVQQPEPGYSAFSCTPFSASDLLLSHAPLMPSSTSGTADCISLLQRETKECAAELNCIDRICGDKARPMNYAAVESALQGIRAAREAIVRARVSLNVNFDNVHAV
jgi:hypothetical protein